MRLVWSKPDAIEITELVDVNFNLTADGNPYAVLKIKGIDTPWSTKELFIFSDIFYKALKDKILVKGNNLRITSDVPPSQEHLKKVNIKKITKINLTNKEQTL